VQEGEPAVIKTRYKQFSAINVTNLVDVTLVLLVIFMLSAPVIQRSAEVRPPSSDQGMIISHLDPGEALIVEVDAYGNISAGGQAVLIDDLASLAVAAIDSGRLDAFVRADRDVRYESVSHTLTELRRGGYENVGLIQESVERDE
jgi:biopolymer transport protein TolR